MTRQVQRRVTAVQSSVPRVFPSVLAGQEVRGACGWCITRDHGDCMQRVHPDRVCKCPCPKA
jgi:hypothetical protein